VVVCGSSGGGLWCVLRWYAVVCGFQTYPEVTVILQSVFCPAFSITREIFVHASSNQED